MLGAGLVLGAVLPPGLVVGVTIGAVVVGLGGRVGDVVVLSSIMGDTGLINAETTVAVVNMKTTTSRAANTFFMEKHRSFHISNEKWANFF